MTPAKHSSTHTMPSSQEAQPERRRFTSILMIRISNYSAKILLSRTLMWQPQERLFPSDRLWDASLLGLLVLIPRLISPMSTQQILSQLRRELFSEFTHPTSLRAIYHLHVEALVCSVAILFLHVSLYPVLLLGSRPENPMALRKTPRNRNEILLLSSIPGSTTLPVWQPG